MARCLLLTAAWGAVVVSAAFHPHLRQDSTVGYQFPPVVGTRALQTTTTNTTATCPTGTNPLALQGLPVLTSLCPVQCGTGNVCIFYPANATSDCTTTTGRTCIQGSGCAFECIRRQDGDTNWLLSLYTDGDVVNEVVNYNVVNPANPSIAVNASTLHGFVGNLDATIKIKRFSITGNEAANNFDTDFYYANDAKPLPRGEILPFDVPAAFFETLQSVSILRLENVKVMEPSPNVSLTFPSMQEMFLRNTQLKSVPFVNASTPVLRFLDLSMNRISDVKRIPISPALEFVNLSSNAIASLPLNAFPSSVWALDLYSNPLKEIPPGTLSSKLQVLELSDTMLTEVPRDVAKMTNLSRLFIHSNKFGAFPNGSLPVAELGALHIANCSLTAIPSIVKSMEKLENLHLDFNDLSGDQDFSLIPTSMKFITMEYCKLQKLPKELRPLDNLVGLLLAGNPKAMGDLSNLPPSIVQLFLRDNDLKAVPSALANLSNMIILDLGSNPIDTVSPGDLPAKLGAVEFSNARFRTLEPKTLPSSLEIFVLDDSQLEQAPEDIRAMTGLTELTVTRCKLQAFDVADGLPVLTKINLKGNRITKFSGSYPAATILDLRNNTLLEFSMASAPNLTALQLADNNLSSMPTAIFNLPSLRVLNLTHNPIRDFSPSADQLEFLSKLPVLLMDQAMFSATCREADAVRFRKFTVCKSSAPSKGTDAATAASSKRASVGLIVGNVCLGIVLIALTLLWWRRRKQQKKREKDLNSQTVSLEQQLLDDSIWTDDVLLHHRLDADLVKRTRLLGSGASGEVWLGSYFNELVAVKSLKQASVDVAQQFVAEVKLVLSLSHPRIVGILGVVWTKESDLALVTEYMAGGDLRSHLDHTPRPPLTGWSAEKLRIALEITEAVVYLHSLDPIVIHRDLKSRNVLLDADMHAKVTDFGISRLLVDDETMTADVGTMRWMAPEVLAGSRYDESADIYSLGIIFCEIDTHKLPFEGAMDEAGNQLLGDAALATRLLSGALACTVSELCPPEIRSLVEKCTAFDPLTRPTGLQVAYELRKLARVE